MPTYVDKDMTFHIPMILIPHDMDIGEFGNFLIPVYNSEEKLLQNHPGVSYITIANDIKNNKMHILVRGLNKMNL